MAYYIFDDAIALASGGDGAAMSLEPHEGSAPPAPGGWASEGDGLAPFASAWRGIPRAPSALASPPYSNSEGGEARAMERHLKQIHVRMSEGEIERAKSLAADT